MRRRPRSTPSGAGDYLHELAYAIHHSAPGVAASRSPYKARNVDREFGTEVIAAIQAYRAAQGT